MKEISSPHSGVDEELPSLSQFYTSSLDLKEDKTSNTYQEKLEEAKNIASESWGQEGKYKIISAIAVGGMGAILRAWDKDAHRDVAMKVMQRAGQASLAAKRFMREARIVANLEHPNIVPVHDIGISPLEEPYFTMKWLQGENLADILFKIGKRKGEYEKKYPVGTLLDILTKVCNAVAFAHSKKIVHLDLKPHNIIVGEYGEVLLLDWGLAAAMNRDLSREKIEKKRKREEEIKVGRKNFKFSL